MKVALFDRFLSYMALSNFPNPWEKFVSDDIVVIKRFQTETKNNVWKGDMLDIPFQLPEDVAFHTNL